MANKLGLDDKPRELILGSSFNPNSNVSYHAIRCKFMFVWIMEVMAGMVISF